MLLVLAVVVAPARPYAGVHSGVVCGVFGVFLPRWYFQDILRNDMDIDQVCHVGSSWW